jgi:hypothetical protein
MSVTPWKNGSTNASLDTTWVLVVSFMVRRLGVPDNRLQRFGEERDILTYCKSNPDLPIAQPVV